MHITTTLVFCDCPLVLGYENTKFSDLSFVFCYSSVDVFYRQVVKICVRNDILKRKDVEATVSTEL